MISQLNPIDFPAWRHSMQDHLTDANTASLPIVLDVRETWELQTASVKADGFRLIHIPMREVPSRLAELQQLQGSAQPIACLCHHGMRSLQVASYLAQNGFTQVVNLQGGIDAWAQQLDRSIPVY